MSGSGWGRFGYVVELRLCLYMFVVARKGEKKLKGVFD
jgi:hypothetical protein